MVIFQVNKNNVALFEFESYAPIRPHGNGPAPLCFWLKQMHFECCNACKIFGPLGMVERLEYKFQPSHVLRVHSTWVVVLVKLSKPFMPNALYHNAIVYRNDTIYKG